MWWQGKSPSLRSSRNDTISTISLQDEMIVPTSEEFRKLSPERQTEELFILVQRLLPLNPRVDSISESLSSLAERVSLIDGGHKNDEATAQDSDSLYKSLTSLNETASNHPDPFIIKRSREINK